MAQGGGLAASPGVRYTLIMGSDDRCPVPRMNRPIRAALAPAILAVVLPVSAADDAALTRMALCRDSWAEWSKADTARFEAFRAHFMSAFSRHGDDPYFVPKANMSVARMRVLQAFPQSVGMGVGFSLTVDAPFDAARKALETALGKKLAKCETGEGMRSCALEIARQRTVMAMAEDPPKSRSSTLIGCYYFYEK